MRLRYLHLRNYRRHRDTRVEFPDGVLAVLGRNGSGKSTILEALGFALFGVPATRTSKELLRWDGAAPSDPVQVTLECELGDQTVRIVRELKGKNLTPNATLALDDAVLVAPGAGSNEAVTKEVQKRLGMDRDGFFTTVVARQKELARLADLGPTERKRLILGMLGIDALDRAIQTARGRRKEAETRVETLRGELPDRAVLRQEQGAARAALDAVTAEVGSAQTAWQRAKGALSEAQGRRDARLTDHEARRGAEEALRAAHRDQEVARVRQTDLAVQVQDARAAAQAAAAVAPLAGRLPSLQAAHEAARTRAADQDRLAGLRRQQDAVEVPGAPNGLLDQARQDLESLSAESQRLRERLAVVRSDATAARNRLRRIAELGDDAPCPTCERPLHDHLPQLRSGLEAELAGHEAETTRTDAEAAAAEARRVEAEAALRRYEEQARRHEERSRERQRLALEIAGLEARLGGGPVPDLAALTRDLQAAQAAHEEHLRHQARAERLPDLEASLSEATARLEAAGTALGAAQARLEGLPETATALRDAQQAFDAAAAAERQAERGLLDVQNRRALAERSVDEVRRRLEDAEARASRLTQAEDDARYWAALAGGRGNGLLESFKDHLVARIGPAVSDEASRLLARFTNGRYNEVLLDPAYELYVADGGVHYTLDRFSGGEADLVHLALRLAVSRLLLERSGGPELRFLALDEVFGSLDDERRRLVLGALQELGGLYSQVLLVTHHDSLRDSLDAALLVEDRDGEAVVSLRNG